MASGIFLDASVLRNQQISFNLREDIKETRIRFEFPTGLTQLRLIEECRALNCLDVSDPDNFDFMFDITMQMLTGKVVCIYFVDDSNLKHEIGKFVVTDRYMDLRSVDVIDEYPILVNWLVEFVAGMLGKKYPLSLKSIQAKMRGREEHLKSLKKKEEVTITTS